MRWIKQVGTEGTTRLDFLQPSGSLTGCGAHFIVIAVWPLLIDSLSHENGRVLRRGSG